MSLPPPVHRALVRAVLAALAALSLSPAQAAGRRRSPPLSPPASSPIQVEGVVAGVVDRLWRQTDEYWHGGDYPRIVALDRVITEADPQFLEAYSAGGWLMDSLGRTQDAEAFYKLGVARNPHAAYAYWNLGFFYFNTTKDYAQAARVFQMDTRQAGADLNDWKMRAHAEEKAGQWNQAVATWHTIKAKYPNGLAVDRLLRESEQKRAKALADQRTDQKDPL